MRDFCENDVKKMDDELGQEKKGGGAIKKGSGYFVKEAEAWQNQDRTYKYFGLFSLFLNF